MGIIKTIEINDIEESLKEIAGMSFQINLFQEEHKDVEEQIKINKKNFSTGAIPVDIYKRNSNVMNKEKKRLVSNINNNVKSIKKINKGLLKSIEQNKI